MIANYYQRTFTIIQSNFGGFLHYKNIILNQNNDMFNYSKCTLRTVGYHYILSIYHCSNHTNSRTISRIWMDFKMADTSERRVFCNTILLKYHGVSIFFTRSSYLESGRWWQVKRAKNTESNWFVFLSLYF